jgi:RNA polymerase sigma-70 factor (ECF subfamily)
MKKEEQIEQWIELYSSDLLNRAIYLLSDKEEAKDIVQDVFLAAYKGHHSFKENSSAKTWLHTILKNKVADLYRKKYKAPTNISIESYFNESGNWRNGETLLRDWDNVSISGNYPEFEHLLENCIENLAAKWKIPIKLYYLQEKKSAEICQEIGISTTNLWKILQRGRLKVRECLETNEL